MARMQPRSKAELSRSIRRDARMEKLSIHELSRRYGVHRRLVREALTSPWPSTRKSMSPRRSVVDPYKRIIDAILRADLGRAAPISGTPDLDDLATISPYITHVIRWFGNRVLNLAPPAPTTRLDLESQVLFAP